MPERSPPLRRPLLASLLVAAAVSAPLAQPVSAYPYCVVAGVPSAGPACTVQCVVKVALGGSPTCLFED